MSGKYLLNVSIGPVQEFIAEARKTRDLWVGSYLLSYISFKALEPFIDNNDCEIMYPSVTDSPFYKKRKGKPVDQEELQIASLPNHFLVVVPEDRLDQLITSSREELEKDKKYWLAITETVKNRIQSSFDSAITHVGWTGNKWDSLWDSQVRDLWQYMWVVIPVSDSELDNNYQEKAKRIQRFLEERKLTRTFDQWKGSTTIKCTQCGHREVLGPIDFNKISDFWNSIHKKFKANVRKGDRLCAICTAKRFLKSSDILDVLKEPEFESTRDVAVIPFRKYLINHQNKFDNKGLIEQADNLRKIIKPTQKPITKIDDIEGDFLYEDELIPDKLIKEYFPEVEKGTKVYYEKKTQLENPSKELRGILQDIYEKLETKPSKYYAILFMDGDNMGKWMSGALPENVAIPFTKEEHKKRSAKLGEIGIYVMPEIVRKSNAFTVYSGGDDLLAFSHLDYAFELAMSIRKNFAEKGIHPASTTSAGIVIAHYSYSLKKVLNEGRMAVEKAKEMFKGKMGKDSFSITLILSSGTAIMAGYKWFIQNDGAKISVIDDVMGKIIGWQKADMLSPRFIYDVLDCLGRFYYEDGRGNKKFDDKLFGVEAERLFKRHCAKDDKGLIKIPESAIKSVVKYLSMIATHDFQKDFDAKENIEGLLRISTFIAKESVGD